jgi:hypothetical protein
MQTNHLNRRTAENICHAFDFARYLRRPLNTYIVLNFRPDDKIAAGNIFRAIMRRYRYWLKSRTTELFGTPIAPMYVYTFENPNGQPHVNWVVHVPQTLKAELVEKFQGWTERSNTEFGDYDMHPQDVDPLTAKTLANYIIKGIDPTYVDYLHLKDFASFQGQVWGRRATASPALSRAARKEAGFVAKRDRGKFLTPANDTKVIKAA